MNPDRVGLIGSETEVGPPQAELERIAERSAPDQIDARPGHEAQIRQASPGRSAPGDVTEHRRGTVGETREADPVGPLQTDPCPV